MPEFPEKNTTYIDNLEKLKQIKHKKPLWRVILFRTFLFLFTTLFVAICTLYGAVLMINYGPSPSARDLLVMTSLETSALKFLATGFFSAEEIAVITADNSIKTTSEITDDKKIEIPTKEEDPEFDINAITIENVVGATYKGKMMIVNDPSRVFVGTSYPYGDEYNGETVMNMIKKYDAIAGVNGGGFMDINGVGNGGQPIGMVMSECKLLWGGKDQQHDIIGFNKDNKLVVGTMTGQQALDKGIRDALCFGPFLIINGKPLEVSGTGGGLNPRTAIGQRADGAVLLLVVDGRQPSSLGANFNDLIEIMQKYGAINAANLDGGSSSHMIYENEIITSHSSVYGPRLMPNSYLVKRTD